MKFSIKTVLLFVLTVVVLTGFGYLVFTINSDVFFAFVWFVFFASLLSNFTKPLVNKSAKLLVWLLAFVLMSIWFVFNESLFILVSESVNSNPYGEYFLGQFEFRLLLSIFVLKAILKIWLTDARLLIAAILLIFQFGVLLPSIRFLLMLIPSRFFEFVVHSVSLIKIELRRYITVSLGEALINSVLWCLAAFLLQFDNFILMTFIMLLFSFVPRIGLFVGAAMSLLFVESGLFLIQLGGMLIALASMWFVDHTFIKEQELLDETVSIFVLVLLPAVGYFTFSFWGLFLTAPIVYLSVLFTRNMSNNAPLIHKSVTSIPRNV